MEVAFVLFVLIWIASGYFGVKLIRRSTRPRRDPAVPPAQVVNAEGRDALYQQAARIATKAPRKLGRGLGVSLGLALITWPVIAIYVLVKSIGGLGMGTMGRRLRIAGRTHLPTVASETPTGAAVAPAAIGAHWLLAARMEHASVPAFARLSLQLAALGAPARLLVAIHTAALDELRHAERCFAIANALTGATHTAGPIPALAHAAGERTTIAGVALESLVDGCLAEGVAADLAACGAALAAANAGDDAIRRDLAAALAMIARDEAAHAELAWDVLAWCLAEDASVHAAIATRLASLTVTPPTVPNASATDLARFGIPDAATASQLAATRLAAVVARANALLSPLRAAA